MRILALTDIHGNLKYLKDIIPHLRNSDLTVLAGDITNFGDKDSAKMIIDPIREYSRRLVAVYGNCDYPTVESYLNEVGINISWQVKKIGNYLFVGLGGSLICPARTPGEYSEEKYMQFLDSLKKDFAHLRNDKNNIILVTHEPPKDTKCDKTISGYHVGSESIRTFIEEVQPILVITGHIHEGKSVDRIGNSIIINPGPFRRGNYSIIDIESSEVKNIENSQA